MSKRKAAPSEIEIKLGEEDVCDMIKREGLARAQAMGFAVEKTEILTRYPPRVRMVGVWRSKPNVQPSALSSSKTGASITNE